MAKKKPEKAAVENAAETSAPETDITIASKEEIGAAAVLSDDSTGKKKSNKTAQKKQSDKPNIFKRMWKGIKGVISELKKVTWPKGKDVVKSTAVVLVVVVVFFLVLFGIDYVLSGILNLIINGKWAFVFIS